MPGYLRDILASEIAFFSRERCAAMPGCNHFLPRVAMERRITI
jgi:hypothetical protein